MSLSSLTLPLFLPVLETRELYAHEVSLDRFCGLALRRSPSRIREAEGLFMGLFS